MIHYPIPPHKQFCYHQYNDLNLPVSVLLSREVLSLPVSPVITESDVIEISSCIADFRPILRFYGYKVLFEVLISDGYLN